MSYRIVDEPRPGGLASVAVNPFWPLLAVMLGGTWLAWPWFALNGFAVGSPSRGKELAVAVAGFAGSAALGLGITTLGGGELLGERTIGYAILVLTVWKLAVTYWLYNLQSRSFHLYEHFGGTVRNGITVVLVALLLGRGAVLAAVDDMPIMMLLLS